TECIEVTRQRFADVRLDEREPRLVGQVRHVVLGAGDEVVHGHDRCAPGEQRIDEVRTNETGTAGDHDPMPLAITLRNRHADQPSGRPPGPRAWTGPASSPPGRPGAGKGR